MVRGKLRCLGTVQHLKASLGSHYDLEVKAPVRRHEEVAALADTLFAKSAVVGAVPSRGVPFSRRGASGGRRRRAPC